MFSPNWEAERPIFGVSEASSTIRLASATQADTDLFLTDDRSLVGKIVPGIQVIAVLDTQIL